MKKFIRKIACLALALLLVFSTISIDCFTANAFETKNQRLGATQTEGTLATPTNLEWKSNSTATASWDAVDDANYYNVKVYVSYNGTEIGSRETGTASTEIDLQQEINSIVENANYNTVQVTFDVQAKIINITDNTYILGKVSGKSGSIDYLITAIAKVKFETPTNLTFDKSTLNITWNGDKNTDMYYIEFKFDNNGVVNYHTTYVNSYEGRDTTSLWANISAELYRAYRNIYSKKTDVKVSYRLYGTYWCINNKESYYYPSDWSDWSQEINYSRNLDEKAKFETPSNLTFDENTLNITWNGDMNSDMYYIQFKFDNNGVVNYYTTYVYPYEGRDTTSLSANISVELYRAYRNMYSEKTDVKVSYRLYSTYYCTNDKDLYYDQSDWSNWSQEIHYSRNLDEKVKLETPTNLTFDESTLNITWNGDKNADMYYIEFMFDNNRIVNYYTPYVEPFEGRNTTSLSANISENLYSVYKNSSLDPAPVLVSYRLQGTYWCTNDKDLYYYPTDWSEWSNEILYNPNNLIVVDTIKLSPIDPVVAVGDTIYLGKTISPENAYYSNIQWSSSDTSVATVNRSGQITGVSVGSATITAKIGKASTTATVCVYQIESNIEDPASENAVIDETKDIIESIISDGDASGTDIDDVEEAREEIEDGAQNGNDFNVNIHKQKRYKNQYSKDWDKIKQKAGEDKEFAGGYDVNIAISHKDSSGQDHHIGNITEFDDDIKFTIDKPTNLPKVPKGYKREYKMVRIHDGQVETVPLTQNGDGSLTVKSDKFSEFVLLYSDSNCTHVYTNYKYNNDATWTTNGTETGKCSVCGQTDTREKKNSALGLKYAHPVFKWSADGKSCKVTYTCSKNSVRKETKKCTVTSKVKVAATCTKKGTTIYTATYGVFRNTKVVQNISLKPHVKRTRITKATTRADGKREIYCSSCKKVFESKVIKKIKTVSLRYSSTLYTGKGLKPAVTVKDSAGKTIAASNYTVTYKNNKNVGKAIVTIKFKGNYSGTITKTFLIYPKETTVSKLTASSKGFKVSWKKQTTQTTGYEIQYATDKKFTKNKKTVSVKNANTTSTSVTQLKAKTKYYVRIRTYKIVSGIKNYSTWKTYSKTVTTKK